MAIKTSDVLDKDEMAIFALNYFKEDLMKNAEKNWTPEQVIMLKALIASTVTREDYGKVYKEWKSPSAMMHSEEKQ